MNHPVTKTLLALGCAGTLTATANAQLPTTYTAGDFLVGFREVGNTNSVVVDIGPIANFTTAQVFAINAGATLNAQYGNTWEDNANVDFSLAATSTSTTNRTNYVTSPEYLSGPNVGPAQVWSRQTNTVSGNFQSKISNLGSEFATAGEVQNSTTDPNAYQNFMPGGPTDAGHANAGIAWGYFNPTSEGNFGQGASTQSAAFSTGVALDLIQLQPGSGPGNDLGIFQLSSDGNTLTYSPAGASVVPEPSSVAVSVLAGLALLGFQLNKARKSSTKGQVA